VEIARDLAPGRLSAKNVAGFLDPNELAIVPEPQPASWYLRLMIHDEPRIIARVAEVLAREGMNIDSVQQEPHSPKSACRCSSPSSRCQSQTSAARWRRSTTTRLWLSPCCC